MGNSIKILKNNKEFFIIDKDKNPFLCSTSNNIKKINVKLLKEYIDKNNSLPPPAAINNFATLMINPVSSNNSVPSNTYSVQSDNSVPSNTYLVPSDNSVPSNTYSVPSSNALDISTILLNDNNLLNLTCIYNNNKTSTIIKENKNTHNLLYADININNYEKYLTSFENYDINYLNLYKKL
jgi:hypothetical protein